MAIALGLHIGHDRAAALVKDGRLLANVPQERVDRVKHSHSPHMPVEAVHALLKYCNVDLSEVSCVGITYSHIDPENINDSLKEEFQETFEVSEIDFTTVGHHLAHAESAWCTSDFDDAVVFVADGSGDFKAGQLESESVFLGTDDGDLELVSQRLQGSLFSYVTRRNFFMLPYMSKHDRRLQLSIGRKYEQITYLLGFGWGQAGKTMALASFGEPLVDAARWCTSFSNADVTASCLLNEIFEEKERSGQTLRQFVHERRGDIAATIQSFTEEVLLSWLKDLYSLYPRDSLCLAGGLFLNCVLNTKVLERTPFKRLHVVPAAGDDGQAVGAAFHAYRKYWGPVIRESEVLPYLGASYSREAVLEALDEFGLEYEELTEANLIAATVDILTQGSVLGVCRGRSEFGPRALCNRSLLADPRSASMHEHLNRNIKHREMFRPFAPVVTQEDQGRFFDLDTPSPYMLLAGTVNSKQREAVPAITHVDFSARVQSVTKSGNSFMHKLLKQFEAAAGVPVLLNTSFNLAGEPIVESPRDAISCFLRAPIDALVFEGFLVRASR